MINSEYIEFMIDLDLDLLRAECTKGIDLHRELLVPESPLHEGIRYRVCSSSRGAFFSVIKGEFILTFI